MKREKFEVVSGKMILSDPCYTLGTWCQGVVENVKNGEWIGIAETTNQGSWGDRISMLLSMNVDAMEKNPNLEQELITSGEPLPFDGGVDSGQFGHFDFDNYRKDELAINLVKAFEDDYSTEVGDEWYRACCEITIHRNFGVMPFGIVSSSGFGDGAYTTYGIKDDSGQYVGFMTIFIDDEDQDQDDDDYIMSEYDGEEDDEE
jgi:hypothetical protein